MAAGSPPDRDADRELMSRVAAGDAGALSDLYDRYAASLAAVARRVLGSMAEAEEVLQEVFVHVWRGSRRYDSERAAVSTWLALLTRSRAIDRLRSRKVADRTAEAAFAETPGGHESPRATRAVLHHERRERIAAALRDLPPEQRQVIELAYFRGYTQTEISDREGIPLGTVKTRTLLAMKKLRSALATEIEDLL